MDYLFENLGDERFQEFCAALLQKEYPEMQVFPVGQPDGGRDMIAYHNPTSRKEFIVFQVKFTRNPHQDRESVEWLQSTLKGEAEKVAKLISKGAVKYFLITNVKGTAHLDSGTKDKVDAVLKESLSIPAMCLWRDDLSRRIEADTMFKWSFPEILNGQDVLNSVLFGSINENRERRESVIRAYLIDQYEIDNEVKFKQIDLRNRLLNLFTDVPIRIKKFDRQNRKLYPILDVLEGRRFPAYAEFNISHEEKKITGAAEFILHPKVQEGMDRILLEGGPGQGKSTISQYICQVHRVRLLEKNHDIEILPSEIKATPIRLPIKIDLRDVAAWMEKRNPYAGILPEEYFNDIWKNSLEAFLVGHIYYHSKLEEFNSNDLIAVFRISPILLVFDGFDEIAKIEMRAEVVEFINKGIIRISANARSVQVVVTSRPAAFSDSVGFSVDKYPHFELTDITTNIINVYVEKWIKASGIELRDANELRHLIAEKLKLPHLKELAKSPMQLAIFISLLRTKGQSLPNKRTALYDSYIELVFDRESEKNTLIRDKRTLIVDIHQYLAWILHSEAELLNNNGSIDVNDLNERLKIYLRTEGHDESISAGLFDVMRERVCALVSRVQGTFEFEVQPLREYFCAKYLYESAPHSSAGSVKSGTKPDRLNAILRNFYWQNVVRFFAGCADAGELDMIIQELKDLQTDVLLRHTNYPRMITSQIMSDYVFTQKPLKLKDVVKIIVDGINIGNIINQDGRYSSNEPLLLPDECGRIEVVRECFSQLATFPKNDYAYELIGIINNNPVENLEKWSEYVGRFTGGDLTRWMEYGYRLGLMHKLDELFLKELIAEGNEQQKITRLQLAINGSRITLVDNSPELKRLVFDGILNNSITVFDRQASPHSFSFLTVLFHPYILARILNNEGYAGTLGSYLHSYTEPRGESRKALFWEFPIGDEIDEEVKRYSNAISSEFDTPLNMLRQKIQSWDILHEAARNIWGDRWAFFVSATIAAGIKSKEPMDDQYSNLEDESLSLAMRVRLARMKSGNIKYWEHTLAGAQNRPFVLLVCLTWATPKTIIALVDVLAKLILHLDEDSYAKLADALANTVVGSVFNREQQQQLELGLKEKKASDEFKFLVSLRFDRTRSREYNHRSIRKYKGVIGRFEHQKLQYLVTCYLGDSSNKTLLQEIRHLYKSATTFREEHYNRIYAREEIYIPYELAKSIMENAQDYPKAITVFAEKSCRRYANKHMVSVGNIAKKQKWFV